MSVVNQIGIKVSNPTSTVFILLDHGPSANWK